MMEEEVVDIKEIIDELSILENIDLSKPIFTKTDFISRMTACSIYAQRIFQKQKF